MGIISWIIFGLLVGLVAKLAMPGRYLNSFIITILIGIAGALVGGFIAMFLGLGGVDGFNILSLVFAVLGSIIPLFVWRLRLRGEKINTAPRVHISDHHPHSARANRTAREANERPVDEWVARDEPKSKPLTVFYSYSHEDEDMRIRLEKHLAVLRWNGLISEWHDRRIEAGDDWKKQIDHHLAAADIVLLLLSADFINSDYCWGEETKRALERHRRGEAQVIPVILRHCLWQRTPIAELQVTPRDGKPITSWTDRDEAFANVVMAIERAARKIKGKAPADRVHLR